MQSWFPMETTNPSLTKADCEVMLEHVDASLTILRRDCLRPTFDEMKIKTTLSVLRGELTKAFLVAAGQVEQTFTD